MLEKLSYIKRFHPLIFQKYESRLMFIMGLFYKTTGPNSFLEKIYYIFIFIHGTDTLHRNQKNWNIDSDLCVFSELIKKFYVTGFLKKIFSLIFRHSFGAKFQMTHCRINHFIRTK